MLASEPISRARELLSDEVAPYRWGDPSLIRHCADSQAQLYRDRRDCVVYGGQIRVAAPTAVTALGSDVGVDDKFKEAMAYAIATRALTDDSEHGNNPALAASYLERYRALIQ